MSWTKLAPILKTTGRPMASASIVVNKDGVPKIALILSASLKDEFGDPAKADVSAGTGDDEGKLLVEFSKDGAFDVRNFVHGGCRIFVPVPEGLPDKPTPACACSLGEKAKASVVVCLPVEAWRREIAGRLAQPRPGPEAPSAAPPQGPPKPRLNGEIVDVVDYLGKKGVKVSRLAGGRFMLFGETVTIGRVLNEVNKHRDEAGLTPLAHSQVQ